MSGPPTKKQRLGGLLFPDGDERNAINFAPPQRPQPNEAEEGKTKQAQADQTTSRTRGPFIEDDSDDEDSTTAASATQNQQASPAATHAAKLASAIEFFKDERLRHPAPVNRTTLQKALKFYADAAAKKKTAKRKESENDQLMRIAGIKSLAKDIGMNGDEVAIWIKSAVPYLQEWKSRVINSPKFRAGLLVSLGEDRSKWDDVAFRVARLCVDETLGVVNKDPTTLNYSCRCAQAACQIVLRSNAGGRFADASCESVDIWRHQCAVRLLFAVVADFLDRADGYFAHLLGVPIPRMHKRN